MAIDDILKELAENGTLCFVIRKNIETLYEDFKDKINAKRCVLTMKEISKFKSWINDRLVLNGYFESNNKICPCSPMDVLRAYKDELMPKGDDRTRNAAAFEDLYYSDWTLHRGQSLFTKLQKIEPETPLEREVLWVLMFASLKMVELNAWLQSLTHRPGSEAEATLNGHKIKDWGKKPKPDKFTCSFCFRRQAKDPNNSMRLADHAYENVGYRYNVCPGINYPPLEESAEGLLVFADSARKRIIELNEECAAAFLYKPNQIESVFSKQTKAKWAAQEIELRNYFLLGINDAGSYAAFLEKCLAQKIRKHEYNKHLYAQIQMAGEFDFLQDELDKYFTIEGLDKKIPFFEFVEANHNIDRLYTFSVSSKKADYVYGNETFDWLKNEINIYEFLNAVEVYGRVGNKIRMDEWLKLNMSQFKDMPL